MAWGTKEKAKAYAHAYYLKHKDDMYSYSNPKRKESAKRWRKNNRLKSNRNSRKYNTTEKASAQWLKHKDKHNFLGRQSTAELSEKYIIKQLKKQGFTEEQIIKCPELIDTKRIQIKTKRLWKQSQTSKTLEKA